VAQQPQAAAEQGQRGEQLVGRRKDRPEALRPAAEQQPAGGHDRDQRGNIAVGDERIGCGRSRHGDGGRCAFRPFARQEKLLPGETGQARGGVERRHQKSRQRQRDEHDAGAVRQPQLVGETRDAAGEQLDRALRLQGCGVLGLGHHADRDQRDDRQHPFDQHAAVGDRPEVALVVHLLGGGARGHQRVEAGAGAARHSHKQQGNQRIGSAAQRAHRMPARESVEIQRRPRHENADEAERHHGVEQVGVQIVARLQQQPHRQHRGRETVGEQHDHPDLPGGRHVAAQQLDKIDRDECADIDAGKSQRHKDQRSCQDAHAAPIDQTSEADRQPDEQQRSRGDGRNLDKGFGHDAQKLGHDQNQREPAEEEEEHPPPVPHQRFDHRADRAPLVTDRQEHRGQIMHRPDEDAAQHNPERDRHPAELRRQYRPDDRPGAGDAGEVVAEQDCGLRRHVVHAVAQRMRGRLSHGIDPEHPFNETSVKVIREIKQHTRDGKQQCPVHGFPFVAVFCPAYRFQQKVSTRWLPLNAIG